MTTTASLDDALSALWASEPEALSDPYPVWRSLRDEAPVHRFGDSVLFSRHADVRAILTKSTEWFGVMGVPRPATAEEALLFQLPADDLRALRELQHFDDLIISRTGDFTRHGRLRRIAHRAFTPRRIVEIREIAYRYVDELLAPLGDRGVHDLAKFCYRLPLALIATMLGVPQDEHERVHAWTAKLARSTHRSPPDPAAWHAAVAALADFTDYVGQIVARHRSDPGSVSELVASMLDAEQGERATAEELTAMFVNFLFAGHETTSNLISIGLAELLRHPDQWQRLAADPSLAPAATEELLRFVSPAQFGAINATSDFTLGGIDIEAGETVYTMIAAANRDADVFTDPDTLDITRPNRREHLAFGVGPRYCLGQALARMEGDVVFSELARRFPNMRLATGELEWHGVSMLRRLKTLPVALA
jgi:cytochrome P450